MVEFSNNRVRRRGDMTHQKCLWGELSLLHVSKAKENPGRRFFNCAERRCSFFVWVNSPSPVENSVGRATTTAPDVDFVNLYLSIAKDFFLLFVAGMVAFGLTMPAGINLFVFYSYDYHSVAVVAQNAFTFVSS
ncbi:uncharacterized protein LOC132266350 [Cornus florida]|uniref:uncharacterized protein LOC132266350 n=1 Tax=Cornus florida TaxID=4283 RepID=UPI0028994E01|nr:uncharacterized protein LOC132266350 [Cornus florida]